MNQPNLFYNFREFEQGYLRPQLCTGQSLEDAVRDLGFDGDFFEESDEEELNFDEDM